MICSQCHRQSPDTAKFCIHCGVKLIKPPLAALSKKQEPAQPAASSNKTRRNGKAGLMIPALRVKTGEDAGQIFPMNGSRVEFTVNKKLRFAVRRNGTANIIRPMPQSGPVYVNNYLLEQTHSLAPGDEISVPPHASYIFDALYFEMAEDELHGLVMLTNQLLAQHNNPTTVRKLLIKKGLDPLTADEIVRLVQEKRKELRQNEGKADMSKGAWILLVGVGVALVSLAASGGSSYLLAWGTILVGALYLIQGAFKSG